MVCSDGLMTDAIVCGDSRRLLAELPPDSVDLVLTSPPYFQQRVYGAGGLGGEATPEAYVAALLDVFRACVRVVKPTGGIVFNIGDKYAAGGLLLLPYRFALAASAVDGVTLVNQVTWVKTNPTPRQFRRRLVSATEPFFHFVKSKNYKYFPESFADVPRAAVPRAAGARLGAGYLELIERSPLTPEQKAAARRAVAAAAAATRRGEIQGFRLKLKGVHAAPYGGGAGGRRTQLERDGFTLIRLTGKPLKRDVIVAPVASLPGRAHPAVYPVAVAEAFIRLLTEVGDLVLDPFVGSGSTAVAARLAGRRYLGYDICPEYCAAARARLARTAAAPTLWDEAASSGEA